VLPDPKPGSQTWCLQRVVRKLLQAVPRQCPTSCGSSRNGPKPPAAGAGPGEAWLWGEGCPAEQAGTRGHAQPRPPARTSGERRPCVAQPRGRTLPDAWDLRHALRWKQKPRSSPQTAARIFVSCCVHSR